MKKFLILCFLLCMPAAALAQDDVAALKARIAELERENAELRSRLVAIQGELQQARDATHQLQSRQRDSERQRQAMYIAQPYQHDKVSGGMKLESRSLALAVTHGSRADHTMQLIVSGSGLNDPNPTISLKMSVPVAGRIYANAHTLQLLVDDQPMTLQRIDYHRDTRVTGSSRNRTDRSDEYLTFALTLDQVRQIGQASTITGQTGTVRYTFSNDLIRMFATVADSMSDR